jgi:hypothetical protein
MAIHAPRRGLHRTFDLAIAGLQAAGGEPGRIHRPARLH